MHDVLKNSLSWTFFYYFVYKKDDKGKPRFWKAIATVNKVA